MLCLDIFFPFLPLHPSPSFTLFVAVMRFFQRKNKKSRKGRVLQCPFSFSSPVWHLLIPKSIWIKILFASCLLDYNSGPHLRPGSPSPEKLSGSTRKQEKKDFSEKKEIQTTNTAENRAWAPKLSAKSTRGAQWRALLQFIIWKAL